MGLLVFYRDMGTFLPILIPGCAPYSPKTRLILVIYRKVSNSHFPQYSCDIFPINNIYTVFHREMDTFLPILTPRFPPYAPKTR